MKNIDYALVEEKRPPMYTAMKYWGKKPHNIWGTYIDTYTDENGIILDPFSGSAVAAFEAVKCGRKAVAFDINPLTAFMIDVYSTEFNIKKFEEAVKSIINKISNDKIYKSFLRQLVRNADVNILIYNILNGITTKYTNLAFFARNVKNDIYHIVPKNKANLLMKCQI